MDGPAAERELRKLLEGSGHWVVRAAGSLGDADLVVLFHSRPAVAIEVKATSKKYYSPGLKGEQREQWDSYIKKCEEGFDVWYAVKFSRIGWRFFELWSMDDENHILRVDDGVSFMEMVSKW